MKNSVLYRMVSVFAHAAAPQPVTNMTVYDWLRLTKYDTKVMHIRAIMDIYPEKAKTLKKQLPAVTISGRFTHRSNYALIEHSGLICIDIDGKDNPEYTTAELKEICSYAPWVAYAGESVSGNGVFAIVPIEQPAKHVEHFRAIQRDFEEFGIRIDAGCSEVSRLRFYSWDPKPYWNHHADIYGRLFELERKAVEIPRHDGGKGAGQLYSERDIALQLIDEICKKGIDVTGGNKDWFNLGCSLASEFGEQGRGYFHAISQFYRNDRHRYSEREADKMYDRCLKYAGNYSIKSFIKLCGLSGVQFKQTA